MILVFYFVVGGHFGFLRLLFCSEFWGTLLDGLVFCRHFLYKTTCRHLDPKWARGSLHFVSPNPHTALSLYLPLSDSFRPFPLSLKCPWCFWECLGRSLFSVHSLHMCLDLFGGSESESPKRHGALQFFFCGLRMREEMERVLCLASEH